MTQFPLDSEAKLAFSRLLPFPYPTLSIHHVLHYTRDLYEYNTI